MNGLSGAVFDSPCGELLIHEPSFLAWFLGLGGRAKPRAGRKAGRYDGSSRKGKLFATELMEGFDALTDQRAGKRTLPTHAAKPRPAPKMT
jgi:hypothetical protein